MQAIKDFIFGEDFKGFGDFKSYENGEKKYNKKSLMRAIEGYFAIVENQNEETNKEYSSLHKRYPPADIDRIRHILNNGGTNNHVNSDFSDGSTALIEAARLGNAAAVRAILEKYPKDLNQKSRSGIELTRWAILQNQPEAFHVLCDQDKIPKNLFHIFIDEITQKIKTFSNFDAETDEVIAGYMEIEESDPFHPVAMYNLSEKGMEIQKIEQLYKILRPLLYVHRAEAAQQLRAYWGRSVHFSTQIANSKKMFQLHLPNIYKDMIQILRNKIEMGGGDSDKSFVSAFSDPSLPSYCAIIGDGQHQIETDVAKEIKQNNAANESVSDSDLSMGDIPVVKDLFQMRREVAAREIQIEIDSD